MSDMQTIYDNPPKPLLPLKEALEAFRQQHPFMTYHESLVFGAACKSYADAVLMSDSQTPETPTPQELLRSECPYGDPHCPCQDGDACHYEGDDPMTPPEIGDTDGR